MSEVDKLFDGEYDVLDSPAIVVLLCIGGEVLSVAGVGAGALGVPRVGDDDIVRPPNSPLPSCPAVANILDGKDALWLTSLALGPRFGINVLMESTDISCWCPCCCCCCFDSCLGANMAPSKSHVPLGKGDPTPTGGCPDSSMLKRVLVIFASMVGMEAEGGGEIGEAEGRGFIEGAL